MLGVGWHYLRADEHGISVNVSIDISSLWDWLLLYLKHKVNAHLHKYIRYHCKAVIYSAGREKMMTNGSMICTSTTNLTCQVCDDFGNCFIFSFFFWNFWRRYLLNAWAMRSFSLYFLWLTLSCWLVVLDRKQNRFSRPSFEAAEEK